MSECDSIPSENNDIQMANQSNLQEEGKSNSIYMHLTERHGACGGSMSAYNPMANQGYVETMGNSIGTLVTMGNEIIDTDGDEPISLLNDNNFKTDSSLTRNGNIINRRIVKKDFRKNIESLAKPLGNHVKKLMISLVDVVDKNKAE